MICMCLNSLKTLTDDSEGLIRSQQTNSAPTGYHRYTGTSMYPTFRNAELLIVDKQAPDRLHVGDVIVFRAYHLDIPVIHRIIKKTGHSFVTKGDNCRSPDQQSVEFETIIGKATGILTKNGVKPVINGWSGWILAHLFYIRKRIKRFIRPLFRNRLVFAFFDFITRFVSINPSICLFKQGPSSYLIQLIWKNKTIGFFDPISRRVIVNRRYQFLVNRMHLAKCCEDVCSAPDYQTLFSRFKPTPVTDHAD